MVHTTAQVAVLCGVSETTVRNWHREGKIWPDHVSPGGRAWYFPETVERFLAQRGQVSNDDAFDAMTKTAEQPEILR